MLSYLPKLKTPRDFVDCLGELFKEGQGERTARGRHVALVADGTFLDVPESTLAVAALAPEKFAKMTAFLRSPACRRVRTNNHVERVHRKLRYEEQARYKWRRRRTTVRFVVLLLDRFWRQERALRNRWHAETQPAIRDRSSPRTTAGDRQP